MIVSFLDLHLEKILIFAIIVTELVTGTDEEKFISSCPPASSVFLQKIKLLLRGAEKIKAVTEQTRKV